MDKLEDLFKEHDDEEPKSKEEMEVWKNRKIDELCKQNDLSYLFISNKFDTLIEEFKCDPQLDTNESLYRYAYEIIYSRAKGYEETTKLVRKVLSLRIIRDLPKDTTLGHLRNLFKHNSID